ncbi:hypothetical protein NUM3379_22420 [Kineococcus sp. NUM-3379]
MSTAGTPGVSTHSDTVGAVRPHESRRARSTGLAVAGAGIVLFNVAPFLNWFDPNSEENPRTGYESDSLVPFIAYLGLGLLAALVYAGKRARRGQHRGLTLVSMATGIAAALWCAANALNPMGGMERGDDISAQIGIFVALLGAAVWAIGSGLLAKEIEGDDDDRTDAYTRDGSRNR